MSSVFNDQDEGWDDLESCNCLSCRQDIYLLDEDEKEEDEEEDLIDYDDNYLDDYLEDNFFDGDTDGN